MRNISSTYNYYNQRPGYGVASNAAAASVRPLKFGGKELERHGGLGWHDFEARWLSNGRFTTQDPKRETYYPLSPYAYCADNPIRNIDPTGRDYYSVDEHGNIELLLCNDDERDRIYAMNYGKIDEHSYVDVDKGFMGTKISDEISIESFVYGDNLRDRISIYQGYDLGNVYKFMCEHTNVEWSYIQYFKDGQFGMTALGTSHEGTDASVDYMISKVLSKDDVIFQMNHFHNLGSAVVSKGDIVIAKKIASRNPNVRFFIDVLNLEGSPFEYDIYSKAGEIQEVVIYGNQKE